MEKKVYKCDFAYANPMTYTLLLDKAKYMKEHPTEAEAIVWQHLKSNDMGVRFRRQYIINDYIVDFVSLKHKLIIEIDGEYHFEEQQQRMDVEREAILESLGFKILRFTNEEVYGQINTIMRTIKAEIF